MSRTRWLARTAFAVAVVALLASGYLAGFGRFPLLGVREAVFSYASFAAFVLASGAVFAARFRANEGADPLEEPLTAIVPTYRDSQVLERSVESLLAADYPVEVCVVCEPDDEPGVEAAREYADEYDAVTALVNPNPGSKAGAVNAAVERAGTDYFGVFDADQSVEPDFFERATGHLREADVVQTRFVPRPAGVVESLAYDEFTLFGHCFRQLLYAFTGFRMATSKALLFSREAVERTGGYDPDVISEDYDFAHACYLNRVEVRMLYATTVAEESAHTLGDWWGQRKRWMTGNVQVLHRLLGHLVRHPADHRSWLSLGVGVASIGGSAFLLSLVPKAVVLVQLGHPFVAVAPLAAIYLVAFGVRLADDRSVGLNLLLTPLVLPFFSLIAVMAFADYLLAFEGEWFAVAKGEDVES